MSKLIGLEIDEIDDYDIDVLVSIIDKSRINKELKHFAGISIESLCRKLIDKDKELAEIKKYKNEIDWLIAEYSYSSIKHCRLVKFLISLNKTLCEVKENE